MKKKKKKGQLGIAHTFCPANAMQCNAVLIAVAFGNRQTERRTVHESSQLKQDGPEAINAAQDVSAKANANVH